MRKSRWNFKGNAYLFVAMALVAIGIFTWLFGTQDNLQPSQPKNYNTVTDTAAGLTFNVSKNFEPFPRDELATMNPGFSYGYRAIDNRKAVCILSQTKLGGRGSVTAEELRDGILKEVKRIHPDAKLANEASSLKPVKFGDAHGVLLEIVFSEGESKIKRVEIAALGKIYQIIAYCESNEADSQRYYSDFTIFFSSLKLTR